jgi:hypothetical protein
VVSEPLTAHAQGQTRRSPNPSEAGSSTLYSLVRVVCGEFEEFPLEQTTFGKKSALAPSSPQSGISVRTQYASPIPRSDAHTSVAANGQAVRLLCGDDCRLAAVTADIWFGLDTGQDPGWRMMSSRPAIADRDGPALFVRRAAPITQQRRGSTAASPSQAEHAKAHLNGACAAH